MRVYLCNIRNFTQFFLLKGDEVLFKIGHKYWYTVVIVLALLLIAACGKPATQGQENGAIPITAIVTEVSRKSIDETIFLVGNLIAKESINIRSEIEAKVAFIGFEEGAQVSEGQVLFRLGDGKLQAQADEAEARFELAKLDYERGVALLNKKTISRQQFDQFRSSLDATQALLRLVRERMNDAVITAPFSGKMSTRRVSLGQFVNVGQPLSSLIQTDPLGLEFNVPERYLGKLNIGQSIKIATVAYPAEIFHGTVIFISPILDERNRTVLIKADVDNEDGRLKPGMFTNLDLVFHSKDDAIVIPEQAISYQSDQAIVIVMDQEDKAEFRSVEVGLRLPGEAEITAGLATGERIVIEGYQKISPGSQILISADSDLKVRQSMAPSAGTALQD